jgi:AraC-like DNA-binding protein
MKLYIKNMVCDRCKMVVNQQLQQLGIEPVSVELGEVVLAQELSAGQKQVLDDRLQALGFALIDDKKSRLIEQIKNQIVALVHHQQNGLKTNLSDYLSNRLNHDYNYLSTLYSEIEGTTIEKYYIAQKIEKVKELLVYDELSLSEIAYQLNYSSAAYLSNQFKKITGLTPSHFKNIKGSKRKSLDQV